MPRIKQCQCVEDILAMACSKPLYKLLKTAMSLVKTKTSFTKLESGQGAENYPLLTIAYLQDKHFQRLEPTNGNKNSTRKHKKDGSNMTNSKIIIISFIENSLEIQGIIKKTKIQCLKCKNFLLTLECTSASTKCTVDLQYCN